MTHEQRMAGSLTEEQIAFYEREGYLVLPHFLTVEDMAPVRAALEEKVSWIADDLYKDGFITDKLEQRPFETRLADLFAGLTDKEFLHYGRGWRDRQPGLFHLISQPKILDAIESLIGSEIFANPVYNVRPKVPHVAAGAVPWHQDKSYWPDANSNPVITAWVALVDATAENGCLHIMPRTHKKQVLSYHAETYSGTGYTELDAEHVSKKKQAISLPLAAGGVILFNDRCIHMSTMNNSHVVRWSVDLRYQPTDQDPMPQHGIGFLARSRQHPEQVTTLDDWLAERPTHHL
ncbi:phytanoyl-CoA dioxygenase family protein [Dictyobacter formicarum]|uniref:SnoK n=1 Tax=Dictyobacter formicarum TaxID=2778368 RepID=A0ABQ3VBW7_9CHLR|nr:phytanoyl-CoA dioxygenase family protein [Dictyobacter formicarum]GHO83612.1 SnoK [Dictyobacter formicarum]